ncbi:rhoptry apical surface protein 2-like isoform X2 [Hylaeus volcanicus]|uniref:rhoptry apical surface protein 2-like isoform X2 n=1 Tax=Hylaeus volcanicus TaxID=313075 RepID=UPI0023B7A6DE|nr:rhoptry apical surface protein 2-like isoform X2 [Hylaeus volcanicus]
MFPLLFLGGNPLNGALGGLACCTMAASTVYALRKKIPHPSEFQIIGCCCLHGGCHSHEKLNLVVEVHEAANIPRGAAVYVYLECGRFDTESSKNNVNPSTLEVPIFERLKIHVRQMDDILTVSLWRKGRISSTLLGAIDLNVLQDIIEKKFPQQEWYHLKKNDKLTVKVRLSFHRLFTNMEENVSPLVEYAMVRAAREAQEKNGDAFPINFESLDEKEKLKFLSRILEGPLNILVGTGWKTCYFKAIERSGYRWKWVYWHNKEGEQKGVQDMFLSRVDRDRDLWSDGLYEFVLRLRAYLEGNPNASQLESLAASHSKLKKNRPKISIKPGLRTLISPTERHKLEESEVQIPKHHQPKALSSMIRLMESYEDEELPSSSEENPLAVLPEKNFASITGEALPLVCENENSSDSLTTMK